MIRYAETTTVQHDARSWSAWAKPHRLPESGLSSSERWPFVPQRMHPVEHAAPVSDVRARIVLADRSDLMRAGLRVALEMDSGVEVVGEARDSRDAAAKTQHLQADLLVLEADMLGLDGLQTLRLLQQRCPKTRVLLLGTRTTSDFVCQALAAGAAGYVPKAASLREVRSAVRDALNGDLRAETGAARRVSGRVPDTSSPEGLPAATEQLSAREIQVIEQVARGRTNRQIGAELVITPNTVKAHIEHILAKLDVRDRTQAAVRAVELGYVRHASVSTSPARRLR